MKRVPTDPRTLQPAAWGPDAHVAQEDLLSGDHLNAQCNSASLTYLDNIGWVKGHCCIERSRDRRATNPSARALNLAAGPFVPILAT